MFAILVTTVVLGVAIRPTEKPFELALPGLVDAYFRGLAARSVSRDTLRNFLAANRTSGLCALVQLLDGKVFVPSATNFPANHEYFIGRLLDVALLFQMATEGPEGPLPDADIVVCPGDFGDLDADRGPAGEWQSIPALTPHTHPDSSTAIPVPMLARHLWSYWLHSHDMAAQFVPHFADVSRMLDFRGSPTNRWRNKTAKVFFRGQTKAELCGQGSRDGLCFRHRVIEHFRTHASWDINNNRDQMFMPWRCFHNWKLILVLGNFNASCSDRLMEVLSLSSVLLWVDQGSTDWYWPLLSDGVQYLRADPTLESIEKQVRWALTHDGEMQKIAERMRVRAREILNLDSIRLYAALIARAYARILDYTPVAIEDMVLFQVNLSSPDVAAEQFADESTRLLLFSALKQGLSETEYSGGSLFRPIPSRLARERAVGEWGCA